jgi:HK97 gp10 family phage protein
MGDPVQRYGSVTLQIDGMDDLKKKLAAMASEHQLEPALRDALSAGGGEFRKEMEKQAPVETGWLASHFRVTKPFIRLKRNLAMIWVGPSRKKFTRPTALLKSGKKRKGIGGRALKKGETDNSAKSPAMIARELEYGLHHMHQNAFMTRAINAARGKALERVMEKLTELVNRWARNR